MGNALEEGLAIGAHGATQGVIGVKDRAKTEGQDRGIRTGSAAEAFSDHLKMFENGFLIEVIGALILAHNDGQFAAGIAHDLALPDSVDFIDDERPSCPAFALKSLLLGNAVRVPCHTISPWCNGIRRKRAMRFNNHAVAACG